MVNSVFVLTSFALRRFLFPAIGLSAVSLLTRRLLLIQLTIHNYDKMLGLMLWLTQGDLDSLRLQQDVGMLLLVWPPCWEEMAAKALDAFSGDVLAYIGEARGGCTAWHSFFDALEKDWLLVEHVPLPNWHGRKDSLYMYERKTKSQQPPSRVSSKQATQRVEAVAERSTEQPTSDRLLAFFRDGGLDQLGRSLLNLQAFDLHDMEQDSHYMQWLFPTDEPSEFNLGAPLLSAELQRHFKADSSLRAEVRINLSSFCSFLGLQLVQAGRGSNIVVGDNFSERAPICWTAMFGSNPYWQHISRVLHCLGLCSLPDEQRALMRCLEDIFDQNLADCSSAMPYWRKRAKALPTP
eukprot:TRINITY_DN19877_c0_g1_i1.p1 TRINITY_DN19877_c0_g1~~TRINITY_DN19877_c0_g1_i1.p1  ORF type:complete len:351 (-),score=41.22 TRINITY_DN19877_c0_g1_i1:53-1105(-)